MLRGKFLSVPGIFLLLFSYTTRAQNTADSIRAQNTADSARIQHPLESGTVYSLQQCVDSALKNNPTVKTADFTRQTAKTNLDQQRATMLPYVSGYANYVNNGGKSINIYTNSYITENFNSGYYQLSANLTLWNGGSIQNFIRQYSLLYQADKMDWQQAKDQMTVNVILAYLNVLSTQEQLGMAKSQAEATARKVELLTIQNNEGAIAPSDLTDIKGQLGSDELTVITTENALEGYKLALAQFMNVPYTPNMKLVSLNEDLTPVVYNATVDQIYQNATQNLAQVKAANLHLASAEKGVKATRGNLLPTLSLIGQVYTNYSTAASTAQQTGVSYGSDGSYVLVNGGQQPVLFSSPTYIYPGIKFTDQFKNNVNTQVGLALNIPIMNGLQRKTLYKQAKINRDQADFNKTTTYITLRQAVESYYVTMMADFRIYNTLSNQVSNYEESFKAADIKYAAGAMKSVDYIIYKTNIDRARLNFIQAKYNYILQTKVLDYFQGKLAW